MEKFCEIEWSRTDIADILAENEIEPSEKNVNMFIPYKWKILNSKGALAPLFSYKEK